MGLLTSINFWLLYLLSHKCVWCGPGYASNVCALSFSLPSVAGIPVTEHLELNVIPLAVCLTEKFYNTMQEFFLPRTDLDGKDSNTEQDHSHVLGVQRKSSTSFSSLAKMRLHLPPLPNFEKWKNWYSSCQILCFGFVDFNKSQCARTEMLFLCLRVATYSGGSMDAPDGNSFSRAPSIRKSATASLTTPGTSVTKTQPSPPDSPVVKEVSNNTITVEWY